MTLPRPRLLAGAALALVCIAGPAAAACTARSGPAPGTGPSVGTAPPLPALRVEQVVDGLDIPWDVQPVDGDRWLLTERDRERLSLVRADGSLSEVTLVGQRIWHSGETGMMGLAVDPGFASNRRIYTCQGWSKTGGGHDVRVIAWELDADLTTSTSMQTLLRGLPSTSGRHGGCRLLVAENGALLVGTGDAAVGTNPRSLRSLGGKVLRLDPATGAPWPRNTWADRTGPRRYVFSYGHRNVQGLAQRADGTLWSVEHGSYRDDEVNLLRRGADYGWNPVPGYDESVPMTDHSLPGRQRSARWRSGDPTIATSGAAFVRGRAWGPLRGTLAVAALAAERLMFVKLDADGNLKWARTPKALQRYGRLRAVTSLSDGSLLVTTSNGGGGSGGDVVLRVTPR